MHFRTSPDTISAGLEQVAKTFIQMESEHTQAMMLACLESFPSIPLTQGQVTINPVTDSENVVSYSGLAHYFREALDTGTPPPEIAGTMATIPANTVSVTTSWLVTLEKVASREAAASTGQTSPASDAGTLTTVASAPPVRTTDASTTTYQGPTLNPQHASENAYAAARLRTVEDERNKARAEAEVWKARALAAESELGVEREKTQRVEYRCDNETRRRIAAEARLQDASGLLAFMDETNPHSPPEGRLALNIWCVITENGTTDPITNRAVGMQEQIRPYLKDHYGQKASQAMLGRFSTMLTPQSRKAGGVISTSKRVFGQKGLTP